MLVSFSVQNYLSFKEKTTLSLEARSINEHKETNTFVAGYKQNELLKTLAIYGENSSGKSNLIKALQFIINFIRNSAKESQAEEAIDVTNFLFSTTTVHKPSSFEIVVVVEKLTYRYTFTVNQESVLEESLYFTNRHSEKLLFKRIGESIQIDSIKFIEGKEINEKKLLRKNALLISVAALFNGTISTNIIRTLSKFIFLGDRISRYPISPSFNSNILQRDLTLSLIKFARLGFENIKVEPQGKMQRVLGSGRSDSLVFYEGPSPIQTEHYVLNENNQPDSKIFMDLENESLGTQKFLALTGPIIDSLVNGKILVIDEFTSKMHPQLAVMILNLFHSKGSNPNNSQLIFATHNTFLMDSKWFRRDQVIVTEKNESYATVLSNLIDKGVRYDASFEKKYFDDILLPLPQQELKIGQQMSLDL